MEDVAVTDVKSFECPSPSEFDRNFFGDQLSSLSLEQQQSISSEGKPSILTSLCQSSDSIQSPSNPIQMNYSLTQETPHLIAPVASKSSTPYENTKHKIANSSFNLSCADDLATSQISWEESLIKTENSNSPRPSVESSSSETTRNPKFLSAPASLAVMSSLACSGPGPELKNTEETQKP